VKYAFVRDHSVEHAVAALCRNLGVSRSGYYEWLEREPSVRSQQDVALLEEIKMLHQHCRGAYGAVKTWKQLLVQGVSVGKHRVARLRAHVGIEANRKRRFRVSVAHRKTAEASPDLLNREFRADQADRVWVGVAIKQRTPRKGLIHHTDRDMLYRTGSY
jgi:putative transposase